MGFGFGYSSRTDRNLDARTADGSRARKNIPGGEIAHVWAAAGQSAAQTPNGNVYFRGRVIYSYGSHFPMGVRGDADQPVFINADSYSPTTSGHQSSVSHAVRHLPTFHVANLKDSADGIVRILDGRADKAEARRFLASHALDLDNAKRLVPGSYRWSATADDQGESAGAYLARLAKLPAATFPKLAREARAAVKRDADKREAAAVQAAEARALRLADMSDRDFAAHIFRQGTAWTAEGMKAIGTELRRARKAMIAAKRGKLAAASRLATVRRRIKQVDAAVSAFADQRDRRVRAERLAADLDTIRTWRDRTPHADTVESYQLRNLAATAERLATTGRLSRFRFAMRRLADQAHKGASAAHEAAAAYRAKREAAKRAAWLAGENVGAVRFDADTGGAALRIVGDELQTSHGATVPLAHAVKAFRFIKACRERGTDWHRNGRTIRVGFYQVDSITAAGDFVAGCHRFTWPEVERVAIIAGVFDCPASDAALEPSAHAA